MKNAGTNQGHTAGIAWRWYRHGSNVSFAGWKAGRRKNRNNEQRKE